MTILVSDRLLKIRKTNSLNDKEPGKLSDGSLAYSIPNDALYVGVGGRTYKVGGRLTPGNVAANQAIAPNTSLGIDILNIANLSSNTISSNTISSNTITVTALNVNGSIGSLGHVLHSNGTGTYWAAISVEAGNLQLDGGEF